MSRSISDVGAGGAPGDILASFVFAWRNLRERRVAALTALAGFTLAVMLMTLQLGVLDAGKRLATGVFDLFAFDLILVSSDYQFLYSAPAFDRIRAVQALSLPGVEAAGVVNLRVRRWVDPATEKRSSMILLGVGDDPVFVRDPALAAALRTLPQRGGVVLDALSHADYGTRRVGAQGAVDGQDLRIAGLFRLGMFFYAEGAGVVRNRDFHGIVGGAGRDATLGLLRLAPGHDPVAVRERLRAVLPHDVRVLTRAAIVQGEQDYFVRVKPLGILFQTGVVTAFAVGFVVLLHLVFATVASQVCEFATLKAVGFTRRFVYGFGAWQVLQVGVTASLLALALAALAFHLLGLKLPLPARVDFDLAGRVLALTAAMTLVPLWVALRRIQAQDPAGLFR